MAIFCRFRGLARAPFFLAKKEITPYDVYMKAIILAAGKGNRLLPLTETKPKTLVEIKGTPVIDYVFRSLPDQIEEVIIVVKYLKDSIKSYVGDTFYNKKVRYVDQIDIKGTYAALLSTREFFDAEERFLVLNGDDIHDKAELEKHMLKTRTFGIQKMIMPGYYNVCSDEDGYITGFDTHPKEEHDGVYVATGVYVLDTHIFEIDGVLLKDGEYGLPQTLLLQKEQYPLKGILTTQWIPINSHADIEKAENIMKKK